MPAPWWIVSVPHGGTTPDEKEREKARILQQCNGICMSEDSQCAEFPVPELKVVGEIRSGPVVVHSLLWCRKTSRAS